MSNITTTVPLPSAGPEYDQREQEVLRRAIEQKFEELSQLIEANRDVKLKPASLSQRRLQFMAMAECCNCGGGDGLTEAEVDARVVAVASGVETRLIWPDIMSPHNGASFIQNAGNAARFSAMSYPNSGVNYSQGAWAWALPNRCDIATGQFRFRFFWAPTNTNTGNIQIGLYVVPWAEGDVTAIATTEGATLTDTPNGTADDLHVSDWSSWVSFSSITGLSDHDRLLMFRVQRNSPSGADTFTGSVELYLAEMQYTTNAPNDN